MKQIFIITIVVYALIMIGRADDRHETERQLKHYCDNVSSGAHPDYKRWLKYCE